MSAKCREIPEDCDRNYCQREKKCAERAASAPMEKSWKEVGKFEHRRVSESRRGNSNPAIARYVQAERRAGRQGDVHRACLINNQLNRACKLYGFTGNPFN